MRKFVLFIGCLLFVALPTYAENMSAENWYRASYAVLWEKNTWDKVSEAADHYATKIHVHSPGQPDAVDDSKGWLAEGIAGWQSDGWLGSDLAALRVDQLNVSAVVFKAKWRDRYADDVEEYSCGWYLADLKEGQWLFTEYADIDCAEHDL